MMNYSDSELLRQAAQQPELVGELYRRHAAKVYQYLARRVAAPDVEDLLAEVFMAVVSSHSRFRPHSSGSALPWLYGIARNLVSIHHRQQQKRFFYPNMVTDLDWNAVDDRLDAQSITTELRAALAGLTSKEREVLLLVSWEQLTITEVAKVVGITTTACFITSVEMGRSSDF